MNIILKTYYKAKWRTQYPIIYFTFITNSCFVMFFNDEKIKLCIFI